MNETTQELTGPAELSRPIRKKLSACFPANVVEWKPQAINGNHALAIAYIDARAVMKRLDDVLGVDGWEDSYAVLADGCVVCTLRCCILGQWLTKQDVGGESDQKDEGDRRKASFSDAFKRAAVKWGVGRYLYSLPSQWVEYDQQKRSFVRDPQLPPWAIPKKEQPAPAPPASGTARPQRISTEQHIELNEMLERKGKSWQDVVRSQAFNFGAGKLANELTVPEWEAVMQALGSHPDKPQKAGVR